MAEDTIVAVYDTAANAEAAVSALRAANVPESAINVHAGTSMAGSTTTTTTAAPVREQGFWSSLFGGDSDEDAVYERSLQAGSTVVTVKAPETYTSRVTEILEAHHPIDIDERAVGYGLRSTAATGMTTGMATTGTTTGTTTGVAATGMAATAARTGEQTLQLSEERLAVGKRVINRGGTRIRRYVVETPVEESVRLHEEKVVLERRPVTDGRPVGTDEFSNRTIEMTETAEEAVVSKTARVYEEVGLRKEETDRVETVRDTLRKEEAEIEQIPATTTTTGTMGTTTVTGATTGTTTPSTPKV